MKYKSVKYKLVFKEKIYLGTYLKKKSLLVTYNGC